MKKLQCDLCGSIDIIKTEENVYQCQHCGCKYTQEQARMMIGGTVEVVQGKAEFTRQFERAKTKIRLGDIEGAKSDLKETVKEFPDEWTAWDVLVDICFVEAMAYRKDGGVSGTHHGNGYFYIPGILSDARRYYGNACTLCPDEAAHRDLDCKWNDKCNGVAAAILKGELDIDLSSISAIHSMFFELQNESARNAKILNSNNITVNSKGWLQADGRDCYEYKYKISYALGQLVKSEHTTQDDEGTKIIYVNVLWLPTPIDLSNDGLEKIKKTAKENSKSINRDHDIEALKRGFRKLW